MDLERLTVMNLITSIVDSKNYIRNRLLDFLRRVGARNVFADFEFNGEVFRISRLISRYDFHERSLLNSIEKYALNIPASEQSFALAGNDLIPEESDPERFCAVMHENYQDIILFISRLKIRDIYMPITHPAVKSNLSVGWILQMMTMRESDLIAQLQSVLLSSGLSIKAPWASAQYMRPVEKLKLR